MRTKRVWVVSVLVIFFAGGVALAQQESAAPQYGVFDGNPGVMYDGSHNSSTVIEYAQANGQPAFRLSMWILHGISYYAAPGLLFISASGLTYQATDSKYQSDSFQLSTGEMAEAKVGGPGGTVTIEVRGKGKSYKLYLAPSNNADFFWDSKGKPVSKFIGEILTDFRSAVADFQKVANAGQEALAALTPEQAAARIQELRSEIAAAEGRAQNDDQQSAAMQQQGDQNASQGGIAGTVGQTAAYAAAIRFRDVAQSERRKIAIMNQQLQQLQQQIAAAQASPPAPEASAKASEHLANVSAAEAAAAFTMQSGALRNGTAPSRPPATEPSLADTMKFIQDKLSGQGQVNFVAYVTDGTSADAAAFRFAYARSNIVADPSSCRISYRASGTAAGDTDLGFGFWEIEKLEVMPADQFFKLAAAKAGHPEWSSRVDPPVSTLRAQLSGGGFAAFTFYDADLADRVAKAMQHAAELCGAGSKDPF